MVSIFAVFGNHVNFIPQSVLESGITLQLWLLPAELHPWRIESHMYRLEVVLSLNHAISVLSINILYRCIKSVWSMVAG